MKRTQHRFSEVPSVAIPRSAFNRSHGVKTTFDAGYLIPILIDEALPGDTFKLNMTGFARLSTPIFPIMDNLYMDTFFFAVPNRLVWSNWVKFCGERVNPTDNIDYTVPIINNLNNAAGESLADYMGLPTLVAANISVNALPFRAYNLIWNEWFRDQNLQNSLTVSTGDGPDSIATYTLKRRGKRHDYFTSCLPWLQKGNAVSLSLGTSAPVLGIGKINNTWDTTDRAVYETGRDGSTRTYADSQSVDNSAATYTFYVEKDAALAQPNIRADLAHATSSTVNELRQAIQVQRILERDARAGTRYTEIVQSHFGVVSPDARLQRPEYLGGGTSPVIVKPIARTDGSPGKLGAMGVVGFRGHGFVKSFTEHSIIIGLVCVRADYTYQEGIDRMWSRSTRYDYYWPALAHLGEQAVLNKEIYVNATTVGNGTYNNVFGYQERYAEYRYKPSKITGKLRSNDAGTLDSWHLGVEFGSQPTLDGTFIEENPPVDRVIATPAEPHFVFDSFMEMQCVRPMPVYSVPGFIDHF